MAADMTRSGASRLLARLALGAGAALLAAAANPTSQEILDRAPPSAWRDVPPEDLMLVTLGDGSRIAIQLAPDFAPVHVANIRALVRGKWFDGAAIVRVQDNYVVQWGRTEEHPLLPAGVVPAPPAEYETAAAPRPFRPLGYRDAYAAETGHVASWPVARDGKARWLVHCYGMVGVGRENPPDTGSGGELYAVIGHAPRQLDRNIALVGRVLAGIERMADRPRGGAALGFYATPEERIPIASAAIAADLPAAARPAYQLLDSDSPSFADWVRARANREDRFFVRPAGAIDICNAQAPVRARP